MVPHAECRCAERLQLNSCCASDIDCSNTHVGFCCTSKSEHSAFSPRKKHRSTELRQCLLDQALFHPFSNLTTCPLTPLPISLARYNKSCATSRSSESPSCRGEACTPLYSSAPHCTNSHQIHSLQHLIHLRNDRLRLDVTSDLGAVVCQDLVSVGVGALRWGGYDGIAADVFVFVLGFHAFDFFLLWRN